MILAILVGVFGAPLVQPGLVNLTKELVPLGERTYTGDELDALLIQQALEVCEPGEVAENERGIVRHIIVDGHLAQVEPIEVGNGVGALAPCGAVGVSRCVYQT